MDDIEEIIKNQIEVQKQQEEQGSNTRTLAPKQPALNVLAS